MITVVIVSALAGLWPWVVLNDEDGLFRRVNAILDKRDLTRKWMKCPWCSGAWFSIIASVSIFHPSDARIAVTALASAAVTGLMGSYMAQEN